MPSSACLGCSALDIAHPYASSGLSHLNVRPENVLFDTDLKFSIIIAFHVKRDVYESKIIS